MAPPHIEAMAQIYFISATVLTLSFAALAWLLISAM
jgi:hypothetical protein